MKVDGHYAVIVAVIVSTILKIAKSFDTGCQFRLLNEFDERSGDILKSFNAGEVDMVKFEVIPDDFARCYLLVNGSSGTFQFSGEYDGVQYGLTHYFLVNNAGLIILGYPSNVEALSLWTLSKRIQTIQLNISVYAECVSGMGDITSNIITLLWKEFSNLTGFISDKIPQICVFDLNGSDSTYTQQNILLNFPYYTHDVYRKKCRKFECANTSCTDTFVDDSSLSDVILIAAILIPIVYPLFGFLFPAMLSNPEQNPHLYFEQGECPFAPERMFLHIAKFSMIRGKILYLFIFLTWLSALIFCQYQLSKDNLPEVFLQLADSQLQWFMWKTEFWSTFVLFTFVCILYLLWIVCVSDLKRKTGKEEWALFYKKFLILSCRSDTSRSDLKKCFPYIHFMSVVDTPIVDCSVSHYLWTYSAYSYYTRLFSLFSFRVWLAILKSSWDISADRNFFINVFLCFFISPIIFVFNCFSIVLQCTLVSNSVSGGKLFFHFMKADKLYSKISSNKGHILILLIFVTLYTPLGLFILCEVCVGFVISPTVTLLHGLVFTFVGISYNLDYYAPYLLVFAVGLQEIVGTYRYIQREHKMILGNIFDCLKEDLPMFVNAPGTIAVPVRLPVEIYDKIRRQVFPIRECLANIVLKLMSLSFFYAIAFIHIFNFRSDRGSSAFVNVLEYIFIFAFPICLRELFKGDQSGKSDLKAKVEKVVNGLEEDMIVSDAPSRVFENEHTPLISGRARRT